jgi:VanZ family protein
MFKHGRHLKFKWLWLVIGYLMIAFVVQQTLTSSPVTSGYKVSDKILHTVGYFALMGWFMQIYLRHSARVVWGLFFIVMGIGLEFLQGLSGVRQYEVADMFANASGVLIAWVLSYTRFNQILMMIEIHLLRIR